MYKMGNRLYEYFNKCMTDNKKPTYDDFIGLNESYNFLTRDLFEVCYTYKCTDDIISLNEYQKISVFEQNSEAIESPISYDLENTQTLSEMLDSFDTQLFEEEGGINDLLGSMTKNAGIIAGLGVTAIGVAGFGIFSGIRNLFRARKVKKLQLEINQIKGARLEEEIKIAKAKYDVINNEKSTAEEKKKAREEASKKTEQQDVKNEASNESIQSINSQIDAIVGSSNYLKRVKAKYKAEGDAAILQVKITNAEYLGIGDDELDELKDKQKEAAKKAAELEKELTTETSELKKKAAAEGGDEIQKKVTPVLTKIRSLDGKIVAIKKNIEDLGGEIDKEIAASKQKKKEEKLTKAKEDEAERKRQEAEDKKNNKGEEGNKAANAIQNTIDKIKSKFSESVDIEDGIQIDEDAKEKLDELQKKLWGLLYKRQELVIEFYNIMSDGTKDSDKKKNYDENKKSAENKLSEIEDKLQELGREAGVDVDQDAVDAAQSKYDSAKDAVENAQAKMDAIENNDKAKQADIDKAADKLLAAKEALRKADAELKAAKKGTKAQKGEDGPAAQTTNVNPAASSSNKPSTEKLDAVKKEITDAKSKYDDAKGKKAEADKGNDELTKLEAEKVVIQSRIKWRQAFQAKAKLQDDKEQYNATGKDIEEDMTKLQTIDKKIEDVKKNTGPADDEKLKDLNTKLETAQAKLNSANTKKEEISAKEDATEVEKADAAKAVEDAQKEVDDIKAEIEKLKGEPNPAGGTQQNKGGNVDKKQALDDEIARLEKKMEGAMAAIDKAPENKKAEIEKRFDELGAQLKSLKKKKEELGESANIETLLSEVNKISSELDKMIEDINNPNAQTYQTIDERIKNMRNILSNSEALKNLYNK